MTIEGHIDTLDYTHFMFIDSYVIYGLHNT